MQKRLIRKWLLSQRLNLMGLVKDDNTYAGQEVVITYTALVDKANTVENKS